MLYLQALWGGFVWDDRTYFIDNDILPSLKPWNFKEIFLAPSNYWGELLPVRDFLYVIEFNLFGKEPLGYHVVSLLLYFLLLVSCCFFLSSFYRSLQDRGGLITAWGRALVVTLLFGVMPLHVEGVAYISGQKDLLFSLFGFLAMLCFWRYFSNPGRRLFYLVTGFMAFYLSVLSKLTGLMLIGVIPALYFMCRREERPSAGKFFSLWTLAMLPALSWYIYRVNIHGEYWGDTSALTALPFLQRLIRGVKILGAHTTLAIKPYPQSFGYPFDGSSTPDINLLAGVVALSGLILVVIFLRKKRELLLGGIIYLFFLFPALQIAETLNNASIYDRYLFVPVLGLLIMIEYFIYSFKRIDIYRWSVGLLLIIYSFLTVNYVPTFRSDVESTAHTYRHFPQWPPSGFNHVYALIESGDLGRAEEIVLKEDALDNPPWVRSYFKGWIFLEKGMIDESIMELKYSAGLASSGGYFPYPNLPLARALLKRGRTGEAEYFLLEVLRSKIYNPLEYYKAKELLGIVERSKNE